MKIFFRNDTLELLYTSFQKIKNCSYITRFNLTLWLQHAEVTEPAHNFIVKHNYYNIDDESQTE